MPSSRHPRAGIALGSALVLVGSTMVLAPGATADPAPGEIAQTLGLRKAVTVSGIREHQAAFQAASDAHGGNRVGGSAGYDASADYVQDRLEDRGYTVTRHYFDFVFNADRTPPVFSQVSPNPANYVDGPDFASMTYSPNGDVTGTVTVVDYRMPLPSDPPTGASTSGCEAADFAGFPAGSIALVQRGTCNFVVKSANAAAAGASAVIVMNEGQPGRTAAVAGTLGGPQTNGAPVIGTTFSIGEDLRNGVFNGPTGTVARVRVDRVNEVRTTFNVLAETPGGDTNNVVVVGAHLDSVTRGAGINDNGSGSAGILEIAEQLAERGIVPRNKVRFAWWGAEEFGLLGSEAYVEDLSQAERDRILLNLNFDMIGSPNYVRFVYDGDNSAYPVGPGAAAGPAGSGEIERVFTDYFASQGLMSAETPFSGRSDYGPFIAAGVDIPAGGLFTGAEGVKTAQQAADFGGIAGAQYDPCYHLACDTFAGTDTAYAKKGLGEMADAAAHATLHFAKRNLVERPLVDPVEAVSGSGTDGGGGGLHADHDHEETAS